MEAVILAGGFGTRLRAALPDLPKPLAPISGRPFLAYLLDSLVAHGFGHVVLSVGYRYEAIKAAFGPRYRDIALTYAVESTPLGTGGALRFALRQCRNASVFVMNGDSFVDVDFTRMETARAESGSAIALCATLVPDTGRYGRVLIEQGRVVGFAEKGESGPGFINAGVYLLPATTLLDCGLPEAFSFEQDYLAPRVRELKPVAFVAQGRFIDIGVPEDYARAGDLLSAH